MWLGKVVVLSLVKTKVGFKGPLGDDWNVGFFDLDRLDSAPSVWNGLHGPRWIEFEGRRKSGFWFYG